MESKNFFVSKSNEDVIAILDKTRNKSDYICAAIREKYERENGEKTADEKMKELVKNVLKELYAESPFYGVSDSQNQPKKTAPIIPENQITEEQENIETEITNAKREEAERELFNIFSSI